MLKIVVYDSGYGGEFFADRLAEILPTVEIIRVIDWRNAEIILTNPKLAREIVEQDLRPYINNVDLIIFANHLLSITSLKFFQKRYKNQKFIGFELKTPDTFVKRDLMILTTNAVAKTFQYRNFLLQLKRKAKTLPLDSWPAKIDDGELDFVEINETLSLFVNKNNIMPEEIILGCSQFNDIKNDLYRVFGRNIKIYDSFDDTIRTALKLLKIRGGVGKKSS